jgi:hypothetical protein
MTHASQARSLAPTQRPAWTCSARAGELALASVLALLGLFFVWQACRLPLGTIAAPGAGFFPLVLAVLLAVLCVSTCVGALRSKAVQEPVEIGRRDVLGTVAAMFVIPLLFETLGAYLTLGLFSSALLVFLARVSPARAAAASAFGIAAAWYFFKVLLGLQLPNGSVF